MKNFEWGLLAKSFGAERVISDVDTIASWMVSSSVQSEAVVHADTAERQHTAA
jgi:hypothetical protein